MGTAQVFADYKADYKINEAAVFVLGIAFVFALGGLVAASIILCGWYRTKSSLMDFWRGKAVITCR